MEINSDIAIFPPEKSIIISADFFDLNELVLT